MSGRGHGGGTPPRRGTGCESRARYGASAAARKPPRPPPATAGRAIAPRAGGQAAPHSPAVQAAAQQRQACRAPLPGGSGTQAAHTASRMADWRAARRQAAPAPAAPSTTRASEPGSGTLAAGLAGAVAPGHAADIGQCRANGNGGGQPGAADDAGLRQRRQQGHGGAANGKRQGGSRLAHRYGHVLTTRLKVRNWAVISVCRSAQQTRHVRLGCDPIKPPEQRDDTVIRAIAATDAGRSNRPNTPNTPNTPTAHPRGRRRRPRSSPSHACEHPLAAVRPGCGLSTRPPVAPGAGLARARQWGWPHPPHARTPSTGLSWRQSAGVAMPKPTCPATWNLAPV